MFTQHIRNFSQNIEPNLFIGGIAKLGGTGVNAPIDTRDLLATKLNILPISIKVFKVIGEDVQCYIKNRFIIQNSLWLNNTNITYFKSILPCTLGTISLFRNCSNLYEINLPNTSHSEAYVNNNYSFSGIPKLEVLNLNSITGVSNNMIRPGSLLLTEMHLNSVTTIARKGIRNIPNVTVINLKKLKTILRSPAVEPDPFIDTRSDAILNVNSFLATSNGGTPDLSLVAYKTFYPSVTVNFYDDAGVYVSTL